MILSIIITVIFAMIFDYTFNKNAMIFINCYSLVLMFISTILCIYALIAMEYYNDDLNEIKCNTRHIMQTYASFTFFEIIEFFRDMYQPNYNNLVDTYQPNYNFNTYIIYIHVRIAFVQTCFTVISAICLNECFLNNSENTIVFLIQCITIYTFCKFVLIVVGYYAQICYLCVFTKNTNNTNNTNNTDNTEENCVVTVTTTQKKLLLPPKFTNHFCAFATVAIVVWRFYIVSIYFDNIDFKNTEYYFCVASISLFCGHFYNLLSNSNRLNFLQSNQQYVAMMRYIFSIANFSIIIVLLCHFDSIITNTFIKTVAISFEFAFLITELYINFVYFMSPIFRCCCGNKPRECIITKVTRFNKIWMAFTIFLELIAFMILIMTICAIWYNIDDNDAPSCTSTEKFLSFYFTVKLFAIIAGSKIMYFVYKSSIFNEYEDNAYVIFIWIEFINVIVLINCACHESHRLINALIHANYVITIIRFLFASYYNDYEKCYIFNPKYDILATSRNVKILRSVAIVSITTFFVCLCYSAIILFSSNMNEYGAIDSEILKNNVSNSIYSIVYHDHVYLYSKEGNILNVYDGTDLIKLCKIAGLDSQTSIESFENCQNQKTFSLERFLDVMYIFLFIDFFAHIVCWIYSETNNPKKNYSEHVYAQIFTCVCVFANNIIYTAFVTGNSPSGSMFKFLQYPTKQILFVYVYLHPIISFWMLFSFIILCKKS